MRRPLSPRRAALLLAAGAVAVGAARAGAQSSLASSRAFAPAVTPFIGVSDFGARTRGDYVDGADAEFDYNNGLALGVQVDRPLTRRTAFIGTLSVTPLSRVTAEVSTGIGELDRTVVAGIDLGFAGRLKPAAPLFAYLGGGGVFATKRAAGETDGTSFEPRASAGLGLDLMRRERAGFRVMWIAHLAFPGTPDEARWVAESSTVDHTIILGGRFTLGPATGDRQ